MKLKKINIPEDRDWRKILPQLNESSYYLIKHVDKTWYRWICSRIEPAGWVPFHHSTEESKRKALEYPHSWEFDWGSHHSAFEGSSLTYAMSKDIQEIYEIQDPGLLAWKAKRALEGDDHEPDPYPDDV